MNKLQRYDLDNVNLSLEGFNTMVPDYMGALCWYADVSALEAENERLRAWIKRNGMHGLTPDNKSTCFGEIINKGECICGLSAILNREQEKP